MTHLLGVGLLIVTAVALFGTAVANFANYANSARWTWVPAALAVLCAVGVWGVW